MSPLHIIQTLSRGLRRIANELDALELPAEEVFDEAALPAAPDSPPRQKITARQRMVLAFVVATIRDKGYPPTLREIGRHMNIGSTNGVNDHLRALARKGYLSVDPVTARGIRVLTEGVAA